MVEEEGVLVDDCLAMVGIRCSVCVSRCCEASVGAVFSMNLWGGADVGSSL